MSTHLLDSEKYIEDGFIDTSYFGGLIDAQGLFTFYFEDGTEYFETEYFDNTGIEFTLAADLTVAIIEFEAALTSSFGMSVEITLLVLADANITSTSSATVEIDRIREFAGSFASSVSTNITGDIFKGVNANISSEFAQNTDNDRIRTDGATATGEFSQTAAAGAIRQGAVDITGAFTPTLTATFLRLGDIDMSVVTAFETAAARTRDPNATTLANIINLSAQGDRFKGVEAAASITATLEGSLDPLKLAEATVSAIFAATITGRAIRRSPATLASAFIQGVDIGDNNFGTNVEAIFPLAADLSAVGDINISADRFRSSEIDFQSVATQMSVAGFLRSDIANLTTAFALSADVGVIKPFAAAITANSTATVDVSATRNTAAEFATTASIEITADALNGFAADLASEFILGHSTDGIFNNNVLPTVVKEFDAIVASVSEFSVTGGLVKDNSIAVTSTAAATIAAAAIIEGVADITDAAVFEATITVSKAGEIESTIAATATVVGERIRQTGSVPVANTGCVCDPTQIFDGGATLISRATITATVGTLNISSDRTYTVPAEYRLYRLPRENRTHKITRENRVYTIKGAA